MPEQWRALSIRQPWCEAILHCGKNVENRKAAPPAYMVGQPFLVHASRGCDWEEYAEAWKAIRRIRKNDLPAFDELDLGGVVGVAWLSGYVRENGDGWCPTGSLGEIKASPWFSGPVGYLLEHVQPLPFTPCAGALGFWKVPPRVLEELEPDLEKALDRSVQAMVKARRP